MDERAYKSVDFTNIKAESSGRIRTGIAAVFGNVDSAGDRIMPGAFTRTLDGGAKRARFLWNHSYQHPPVASIKELREVTREELPAEVIAKAPDATGGLLVKREYYDTELSNWILAAIDSGDVNEMSFAYSIVRSAMVQEPNPLDPNGDPEEICELQELKLLDCSDVLWGCNQATVTTGAKNFEVLPLGVIASQLMAFEAQIKAGARNAAADQKLLDLMHETCVKLGANCTPPEEEPKSDDIADTDQSESGITATSLDLLKLKTQRLRLEAAITNQL